MKCSELIKSLQDVVAAHGDLDIVGGALSDDVGPRRVIVLDKADCEFGHYKGGDHDMVAGVFLER